MFSQTVKFLTRSKLEITKTLSDEFQITKDVVCRQLERKVWQHLFIFIFCQIDATEV